jgi:branched-chain amino acid transport system substrate-binding protein
MKIKGTNVRRNGENEMKSTPSRRGLSRALFAGLMLASCLPRYAHAESGVTKDTIRIGMFGPITGSYAAHRVVYDGAQAVYRDINAHGGIFGRKIETVFEDDGCDISKARAAVKRLISQDDVFLLHGGVCSAPTFAVRAEAIDDGVPLMVLASTMDKISAPASPYVFTTTLTGSRSGETIGNFIKSVPNVHKVALVTHPDDWSAVQVQGLQPVLKAAGITIVDTVQEERGAADATTQVLSIKEAKPDLTVVMLYPAEMAVFLRDARKYVLDGPFVTPVVGMDMHEIQERAGSPEAVANVYTASFLIGAPGDPSVQPYVDLFKRYYPNESLQALDFYGMSGAYTIVEALKRAGPDLTRAKFIIVLETIKDFQAGPSACSITLTNTDHQGCTNGTVWTLVGDTITNIGPTWKSVKAAEK